MSSTGTSASLFVPFGSAFLCSLRELLSTASVDLFSAAVTPAGCIPSIAVPPADDWDATAVPPAGGSIAVPPADGCIAVPPADVGLFFLATTLGGSSNPTGPSPKMLSTPSSTSGSAVATSDFLG